MKKDFCRYKVKLITEGDKKEGLPSPLYQVLAHRGIVLLLKRLYNS